MIYLKPELFRPLREAAAQNDPTVMQTAIQQSLQNAIKLEFATIPTYLYAFWSLDPTQNALISGLIHSIVVEEMYHLAIACNILNAIAGSPQIVGAVPSYPGPLPGGVESGLVVPLAPFSLNLVNEVFMVIEEPEDPLNFPTQALDLATTPPLTIGAFYMAISALIGQAGESIFTGNAANQVVIGEATSITSVATAQAAISLIVDQGEGTTTSPDDATAELAHYYKFSEISKGLSLVAAPGTPSGFAYGQPAIPFAPTGVLPVITNPTPASYANNPAAQAANAAFNTDFTGLVNGLQSTFNGNPSEINNLFEGPGTMFQLSTDAATLMAIPLSNGFNAGPTFQYLGTAK
jgi:hypothetical protein